jgi:hypothetical protein
MAILTAADEFRRNAYSLGARVTATACPLAFGLLMTIHFARAIDVGTTQTWWCDSHNCDVLEIIDRDRSQHFPGQVITLSNSWIVEPSMNFYRGRRQLNWLAPLTRDPLTTTGAQYVYAVGRDDEAIARRLPGEEIASFPDIQAVLLRVKLFK